MRRRGLSLVEVLIAIVLLGIVGAGITRMLSSQMRFFTRSTNSRDARAVSRNALNLTRAELRMVEPRGVMAATRDSITIRVPYLMGLYCSANSAMFVPTDSLTRATAQYGGYAWRDTLAGSSYTYVSSSTALAVGADGLCTAAGLVKIPGGTILTVSPALGALVPGAPFFLWQSVTYKFANSVLVPGRYALWRKAGSAAAEEIAVPLDTASRINFYTAGTTASTVVPAPLNTLRGIEFLLIGESERTSPGKTTPEESLQRVSIFFRNAVQ